MKQVFIILDGLNDRGQGFVFQVVENLSTFIRNSADWIGGSTYVISKRQNGVQPIWFPVDQIEEYPPLKVFYITFTDRANCKWVYRVERRNVH